MGALESMLKIWDEMKTKGKKPTVFKVVSSYTSNCNVTQRRFKALMSELGKELAERKRELKAEKSASIQLNLFKGD
jgi:hypothetical protein